MSVLDANKSFIRARFSDVTGGLELFDVNGNSLTQGNSLALLRVDPLTGDTSIIGFDGEFSPTVPYTPITAFGVFGLPLDDGVTDQNALFFGALQAAHAAGIKHLYIPDNLRINLTAGGTNPGVSLHTTSGEIHNISPNGLNGRIDNPYTTDIVYENIKFICDNTPKTATNNATEFHACLRFSFGRRVKLLNCSFDNYYGSSVIIRHVDSPIVKGCVATRCCKDSFHFTGNTGSPLIIDTHVINGGDDGIAVVSYSSGTGAGIVTNARILNCTVNGVKFARGISLVGVNGALIENCLIDGKIPAEYEEPATKFTHGGLLICGERVINQSTGTELYRTYAAKNVIVRNTKVTNCGNRSGDHQYSAISILNYPENEQSCSNLLLDGLEVTNSPAGLLNVNGNAEAKIDGLVIRNFTGSDNNDPLGVNGTPGAGTLGGASFANVRDLDVELKLNDIAGSGIYVADSCTGNFRGVFTTRNICSSTSTGPRRIFNGAPNPKLSSIDLQVIVLEQPYATGTTPYGLDRSILWQGTSGKTKRIELITTIPRIAGVGLPLTGAEWTTNINQTIEWTSNAWTNTSATPVMVSMGKDASLEIRKGLSLLGTLPIYKTGTFTQHTFTVKPGETIQVDNTSGLTATWKPITF